MSDVSKVKKKAELVHLCEKATEMKQAKLKDTKDYKKLLEEKLQTEDGKLPDLKTLTAWTNNFSNIQLELPFGDLYSYPVGRQEYSEENLRCFNSLGYNLYHDGHVAALKIFGRADLMILCLPFNVLL